MTTFPPSRSLRDSVDSRIRLVSIICIVAGSIGEFISTRRKIVLPLVSKSSSVRILTRSYLWVWLKSFSHMMESERKSTNRNTFVLIWIGFRSSYTCHREVWLQPTCDVIPVTKNLTYNSQEFICLSHQEQI